MESEAPLQRLEAAENTDKLSRAAVANIRPWLTEAKYAEFTTDVIEHLRDEKFSELNKAFWKILEFGTGGRRGEMYPIGTAVINRRTMGESAAGLAAYVKANSEPKTDLACAIAYPSAVRGVTGEPSARRGGGAPGRPLGFCSCMSSPGAIGLRMPLGMPGRLGGAGRPLLSRPPAP